MTVFGEAVRRPCIRVGTLALAAVLLLLFAGCSSSATPTRPATSAPATTSGNASISAVLATVKGIVDPTDLGWPRRVQALNGPVTVQQKPARIHTVSLGHDEVTYALVPPERVVAVGRFTQDEESSNVTVFAKRVPAIPREPEQILAQKPDIVFASGVTRPELLAALQNAGVTVVQTDLDNSPEGRVQDILFMGYILGEEKRAVALAAEVKERAAALTKVVQAASANGKPRVLSLSSFTDKVYTAGKASTEGAIIESAGGLNAAAEAGLAHNPTIGLEGIVAMKPEVIVIPQPSASAEPFKQSLLRNSALADVPAIKQGRVYTMTPKYFTTLSFWNIRGAEELAKVLWPDQLKDRTFPPFSFPQ